MKLILIGFMGSGKSSVAKLLAQELQLELIELDQLVLTASGRKLIPEIFAKDGETRFRELEIAQARRLKNVQNAVIATGGGVVVNRIILDWLRPGGKVIWLKAGFNTIAARLKNQTGRPLFRNQAQAKKLFAWRQPLYRNSADTKINTDNLTIKQVVKKIRQTIKICQIIGDPVNHSLSPAMHNAAYQKLGIDHEFVFLAKPVKPAGLPAAVRAVRQLGVRGLTCTIPHKTAVIPLLDQLDSVAQKIGAVNTVVNERGKLIGYNTDWQGAVTALQKETRLKNKTAAVFGAGGAARAIVFGLLKLKVKVTIFNRSLAKAQSLSQTAGCKCGSIKNLESIKSMSLIINATSVGMAPQINQSIVPKKMIRPHHVVMDVVYAPHQTKLLKDAQEKGAKIVHGLDMLLYQGVAQFELYTGRRAPVVAMRQTLINSLKNRL